MAVTERQLSMPQAQGMWASQRGLRARRPSGKRVPRRSPGDEVLVERFDPLPLEIDAVALYISGMGGE